MDAGAHGAQPLQEFVVNGRVDQGALDGSAVLARVRERAPEDPVHYPDQVAGAQDDGRVLSGQLAGAGRRRTGADGTPTATLSAVPDR